MANMNFYPERIEVYKDDEIIGHIELLDLTYYFWPDSSYPLDFDTLSQIKEKLSELG